MAEDSDEIPPQQKSDSDSDEIRALLLTRGSDSSGNEEIDAASVPFIDPALFDGGGGFSGDPLGGHLTQPQGLHHYQQQYHPQLYQQGTFYSPVSYRPSQALPDFPQASHLGQRQQQLGMAWQQSAQMNDPFAALMSASTAAAAIDGNEAAAVANVEGIDPMATAAALAAGDSIKVGVRALLLGICKC
jgi:hypothetical protein